MMNSLIGISIGVFSPSGPHMGFPRGLQLKSNFLAVKRLVMRIAAMRSFTIVVFAIAFLSGAVTALAQSVDDFDSGANQIVNTVAMQSDGKIIVGGSFTGLGGGTGTTTRNHIGRLNVDGTVDPTFNPGTDGPVLAVAVQPDGKILAGGNFNAVGGGTGLTTLRKRIARFNADGTVDSSFDPGANLNVYALALQADGKILVGGNFSKLGGGGSGVTTRVAIGRLNIDGTIDPDFNPGASKLPSPGAPPEIHTIVVQPDTRILLGGYFNGLGGGTGTTARNFLGRLNADGTVDTFNPGVTSISGIKALALQADDKILVGGTFTQLGGANRANIGRLFSNGDLDTIFNPGAETEVLTLGVQNDGKILAGGYFKWLGAAGGAARSIRNYIGRINEDGSVDGSFDPGASNVVNAVALQADGGIVAGGVFDRLGNGGGPGIGTLRKSIGRLTNTPATQTLTLTGNGTIETWLRSGSGPEVSRVTFEFSFDGSFYSLLGNGTRVAGGWQLTSVNLPTTRKLYVRARGYYETGQNGSGSIVESILINGAPPAEGDFDGDGKTDLTVYRPSSGTWLSLKSGTNYTALGSTQFGLNGDVPVRGDYDGDGKADIAVFRPTTGEWYILKSSDSTFSAQAFGLNGDLPVPGDYDGDGKTDIAVYRPTAGTWYVLRSADSTFVSYQWGLAGDIPVAGDYDGDGKSDLAVWRRSTGTWFILKSSTTFTTSAQYQWGLSGDVPIPDDYDGDGTSDVAVFRPTTGTWYILQSSTSYTHSVSYQWGLPGDIPVAGDFDGDGKTDVAVFRPPTATWYLLFSTTGATGVYQFGAPGDIPILGRAPSSIATLSGLVLSSGSISPAFASNTTSYTASVANTVTSIKVSPITSDGAAKVTVNGTLVASGAASASIPLAVGTNTITTLVTAQNGTSVKTYTIKVTRAKSPDATLSGLLVKTAVLSPKFKPTTTGYTASVPVATQSVKIKATTTNGAATIKIDGKIVKSGTLSAAIPLNSDESVIKVVVTAQNGSTKTYKITVSRTD